MDTTERERRMYRILCVEDSNEVQMIIRATLSPAHTLVFASSITEARLRFDQGTFDAIILDIGLPDGDGLRFCSELKSVRGLSSMPVFVLTGKNSIHEKTLGFQLGIEDFIAKPFDPIELRLRIESRLKKVSDQKKHTDCILVGPLKIDFSSQRVSLSSSDGDIPLEFSATEFKILCFLAKNLDQVKSREQIIAAAWPDGLHLSDRTVDSHISRIRKKIGGNVCFIEAVTGSGYRLLLKSNRRIAA